MHPHSPCIRTYAPIRRPYLCTHLLSVFCYRSASNLAMEAERLYVAGDYLGAWENATKANNLAPQSAYVLCLLGKICYNMSAYNEV